MKKFLAAMAVVAIAVLIPAQASYAYGDLSGPNSSAVGGSAAYTVTDIPTGIDTIDFTVDGPGAATLTATSTINKPVAAGSSVLNVQFPVSGVYTVTAVQGPGSTATFSSSIDVTVAIAPADAGLADTGFEVAPYIWFGGGLLALGVASLVVMSVVRKNASRTTV